MERWQTLHDRLDQAYRLTQGLDFGTRDLWRMHRAVYEQLRLANAEWVNCRRANRPSPKFEQLMAEAELALKNFESHILMAKLMRKQQHDQ